MVLNKRTVSTSTVDFTHAIEKSGGSNEQVMLAANHQTFAVVLEQLTHLLGYASELYQGIYDDLSETTKRVHDLGTRVSAVAEFMPALEEYVAAAEGEVFISKAGSPFSAESREDAQLLRKDTRSLSIIEAYDTRCTSPPELASLDIYRDDGGSCLKDYTNPDFFVLAWLQEQKKMAKEARQRRQARDKSKPRGGANLRKANELQEVTKLKKTRWNQWGEKIEDDEDSGSAIAAPSRKGVASTPRVQTSQASSTPTTPTAAPGSARRTASSTSVPTQPPRTASAPTQTAPATPAATPAPPATAPASTAKTSLSESRKSAPPKKEKKEKKKDKKEKKKGDKKSSKGSGRTSTKAEAPAAAPAPAASVPPRPTPSAPQAQAPSAPSAPSPPPAPAAPAKPQFSIPQPPPAPSAPDAPNAPPPPSVVIPDAPQVGADEKRSDLLLQIQAGKHLKKVQEKRQEPKETHDDGTINVAAILQRRMAFELSDSEDDGSDGGGDSDWED